MKSLTLPSLIVALIISVSASAQNDWPLIEDLRWVDSGYLERQRTWVDELGRGEFGQRLRGDRSDLRLLQRILDENLIPVTETQQLQALGVALGDVLINELGLEWKVYTDGDGKSRAACLPGTEHCLFPITMLSRRVVAGLPADVESIYQRAAGLLDPYLPKLPYGSRN